MELGALILFTDRLDEVVAFYQAIGAPLEIEDHEDGVPHFACDLGPVHFAVFEGTDGKPPPSRAAGGTMPASSSLH